MEKISLWLKKIFEAPGNFLDSLDPPDGQGPEDGGALGALGKKMGEEMRDNPDKTFFN